MVSPPIENPKSTSPPWWYEDEDTEPEWRWGAPSPNLTLSCGCHLRRPDLEAVLCPEHLAELNGESSG